ncbi:hypothetical protein [Chitinophaga sp. Ak27]|nr:hypothetical protein [Chitinophaga sp. Ak27]
MKSDLLGWLLMLLIASASSVAVAQAQIKKVRGKVISGEDGQAM